MTWYRRGTSGHGWYGDAKRTAQQLARSYDVSLARAAGVIAALSPRMQWAVNVRAASRVLAAAQSGDISPPSVGMTRFVAAAWRIAQGERPLDVLKGPKVRAFYRNLCGDLSHVTVDVWALRALAWGGKGKTTGVTSYKGLSAAEYLTASDAYRRAAKVVGVQPAVFQAVVWTAIRGKSV